MIYIVITSFKEPKATLRAVNAIIAEKIKEEHKIIVVDPFPEVEEFLNKNIKSKNYQFWLDPGEGKTTALNMLFQEINNNPDDIIILTDGDVYIEKGAIHALLKEFKDPKVGCVTGRPVTVDSRDKIYGFWSKALYDGADKVRKRLNKEGSFFQVSGYLFAIRSKVLGEIPMDVPEDAVMPFFFWKEGYKIKYADKAIVYIKYPDNWKDWLNQRVRTIKAHENIPKMFPDMPRTKSFMNEIKEGLLFTLLYPKSIKEMYWMFNLYLARLYIYYKSFQEARKKNTYNPGWREQEIQSTKPLD